MTLMTLIISLGMFAGMNMLANAQATSIVATYDLAASQTALHLNKTMMITATQRLQPNCRFGASTSQFTLSRESTAQFYTFTSTVSSGTQTALVQTISISASRPGTAFVWFSTMGQGGCDGSANYPGPGVDTIVSGGPITINVWAFPNLTYFPLSLR